MILQPSSQLFFPPGGVRVGAGRAGGDSLPYSVLYDDDFTDTDAAPIADPRTCVPGPGQLDPNTPANVNLTGDSYLHNTGEVILRFTTQLTRTAGLATYIKDARKDAMLYPRFYAGFDDATPANVGYDSARVYQYLYYVYEDQATRVNNLTILPSTEMGGNQFDNLVILQSAGALHLFRTRGVNTIPWTLAWVARTNIQASLYAFFAVDFSNPNFDCKIDRAQVLQLGTPFTTDFSLASYRDATPAANDTATGEAAFLQYFDWTVVAAETLEISFRRTDDNNRFIIRCSQSGSTIKLIRVQAGAETELTSAAKTWTATTTYKIGIRVYTGAFGQSCQIFISDSFTNALSNSNFGTFNSTATGFKVAGFTAGTNWEIYPLTITGAALDALPA